MTQRIRDHDLLARVLNVHDADRLVKVSHEEVAHILSAYSDCDDNVVEHDLLSLRAAVRRWISESKKAQKAPFTTYDFSDYDAACVALIAEMGSIDKDGGA